jgi:selenocysteine-specific elongation factor
VFSGEGGVHYTSERACRDVESDLTKALADWHTAHPLAAGLDMEDARSAFARQVPARLFRMLVAELVERQTVVRQGNLLRLPTHQIVVPDADGHLVDRIIAMLGRAPLSPPDVKQIAEELNIDRRRLVGLLRAMASVRSVVHVSPDIYFLGDCVDRVREDLIEELSQRGGITTAEFRDRYQTSRKYAIPLLEYFDRTGLTVWDGEVRTLRQPKKETA